MPRLFLCVLFITNFARPGFAEELVAPEIAAQNDQAPALDKDILFKRVDTTYEVTGSTGKELADAMEKNGPKNYWAFTEWIVSWAYDNDEKPGSCAMMNMKVSLRINMKLPVWVNAPDYKDPRRQRWDDMLAGLKAHEEGHANNGMRAANALLKELSAMGPQKTCAEVEPPVIAALEKVLKAYRKTDKAYDKATDHGANVIPLLDW